MKRILAILCVIACLCGLCVPAMAAGTITVSVKAPAEWTEVFLYVWDNNDSAYEGWPGKAMTKGADGWWTIQIPAGYTNVIANNGNEKPQTVDLKMEGNTDAWITVTTDTGDGKHFNGDVAKDANGTPSDIPSTPANPGAGVDLSGLNSLALVGSGIPGVGEWNPGDAAGDMVKEANGVYTKILAVTGGTTMKFKIAGNDEWNDAYNFGGMEDGVNVVLGTKIDLNNGGGSKDITLTAADHGYLKFTVDLTGDVPTLLVEKTDEEPPVSDPITPPAEEGETYTVYAQVPDDWKAPTIWCWNDSASNPPSQGDWPGSYVMTKGADGWYSVEIPVGYNNLLINANGGSVQTPDITGCGGKDVWINAYTNAGQPTFSHEKITEIEKPAETEPPVGPTKPPAVYPPEDNSADAGSDNTVLFSVIGAAVVIVIAAVIFFVLKGKKKAA
ncbi:MAG: starch-binding protein [Oscillospiraceae bacterium]|nr:starch-binding protein [Oscillospiraceae bacterium]